MQTTALLIGVSDYHAFDHSAGLPIGTSSLRSPENSLRLIWKLLDSLGFASFTTGVLSTPLAAITDDLPGFTGLATRERILDGVRFLANKLAASEQTQALLYFAGHGANAPLLGPVLCASDTRLEGDRLVGVVPLAEIVAILSRLAPGKSITLLLDCCASGLPDKLSERFPALSERLWQLGEIASTRDGDLLLSATSSSEAGVETSFNGQWVGAFTWAFVHAANRYARVIGDGYVVLDASPAWLIDRTTDLLRGLSISQTPQLAGDGGAVFLQPSGVARTAPSYKLRTGSVANEEIMPEQTGFTPPKGDEVCYLSYAALRYQGGTWQSWGAFVSQFNVSGGSPTAYAYTDVWPNTGGGVPNAFKLEFASLTYAVHNQSGALSQHMEAFPSVEAAQSVTFPAGSFLWVVQPAGGPVLGYLNWILGSGSHWYAIGEAYKGNNLVVVENLPAPSGVTPCFFNLANANSTAMLFLPYSGSSAELSSAVTLSCTPAYDVHDVFVG